MSGAANPPVTARAALEALIARLEAGAIGGDLDYCIEEWAYAETLAGCPRIDTGWLHPEAGKIRGPEPYTHSIDAAAALAERVVGPAQARSLLHHAVAWLILFEGESVAPKVAHALVLAVLKTKLAELAE